MSGNSLDDKNYLNYQQELSEDSCTHGAANRLPNYD